MTWFAKRAIFHLSLLLVVIATVFFLFHWGPSDPGRAILGPQASAEQVDALRHQLGLDQSIARQLGRYFLGIARFDFGRSYLDGRNVGAELATRLSATIALLLVAVAVIVAYASLTFWLAARQSARQIDGLNVALTTLPTLLTSVLVAYAAFWFYPFSSYSGHLNRLDDWMALLPPALVLAFYPMAVVSSTIRAEVAKLESSAFVRAVRARGIAEHDVYFGHILVNTMIPVLSQLANALPQLFTSAFLVEIVFSVPGLGSLLVKSILQQDLPMIEGVVIVNTLFIVCVYLLLDVLAPIIDPRMRTSNAS